MSKERYGVTEVPQYEDQPVVVDPAHFECWRCNSVVPEQMVAETGMLCPTCRTRLGESDFRQETTEMFPIEVGTQQFANGSVELQRYSSLEVTTRFSITSLDCCPWLTLDAEQHSSLVMAAYPELLGKRAGVDGGPRGGDEQSREARRIAAGYGTDSDKSWSRQDWTVTRAWLSAEMISGLDANSTTIADLQKSYPDGAKVTYVNGKFVRCENEALSSVWSHCSPSVGDTIYSEPLGNPAVQLNDAINDGYNIIHQTAQKGIPINLYDPNVISPDAMRKMRSTPADFLPAIPDVSGRLGNAIWTSTPAQLHPATMQMMEIAQNAGADIVAITGPLTGSDTGDQTLGQTEIRRNQALLPHNTVWNNLRHCWARAQTNGVCQFATHTDGTIHFRRLGAMPSTSIVIDNIEELLEGGWHVEIDEAIPLTWGQRRAQVFQLMERGPEVMGALQMFRPQNLQTIYKILGNEDFEIPEIQLREKVMEDIRELTLQAPGQGPMGELMPSIPPDDFEMDHAFWVQTAKEWFNGEEGRKLKKNNLPGYMNVLARAKAELQIVNMLAQPPMPPDGGPMGGGPPGALQPPQASGIGPAPPPQSTPGAPNLAAPEDRPTSLEGV